MNTRSYKLEILGLFVLLGAISLILFTFKVDTKPKPLPPAPVYTTISPIEQDLQDQVLTSGLLKPLTQMEVGTQVSGKLRTLSVIEGEYVRQGQLLAEMDPTLARADLEVAQANLEGEVIQSKSRRNLIENSRRDLARSERLFEKGLLSAKDIRSAKIQLTQQVAEEQAAQSRVRQLSVLLEKTKANLELTRILSPISGQVLTLEARVGQTFVAVQNAPVLMKLADVSRMSLRVGVPEIDIPKVKIGQKVFFNLRGYPDEKKIATLRQILPVPERTENGNRYIAIADIDNKEGLLKIDMALEVIIITEERKKTLTLPTSALKNEQNKSATVHVLNKNKTIEVRKLGLGLRTPLAVEVLSGLTIADRVVVDSPHTLAPKKNEGGLFEAWF